jgi:hypothetical protein
MKLTFGEKLITCDIAKEKKINGCSMLVPEREFGRWNDINNREIHASFDV